MAQTTTYTTLAEFYPYYLSEHRDRTCRRLHFVGSTLVLLVFAYTVITQTWLLVISLPFLGYGFAWVGHFFFEKNRPATFTYPVYSFLSDWIMWKDMLTGKIKF
jgi:hypothetical protein